MYSKEQNAEQQDDAQGQAQRGADDGCFGAAKRLVCAKRKQSIQDRRHTLQQIEDHDKMAET